MPEEYEEAIREFESNKERLTRLMDENWKEAAKQLSELKITKLTGRTFPEIIYDVAMYYDRHNKRLLESESTRSASLLPDKGFVNIGEFNTRGVDGNEWGPGVSFINLGVCLSRRL